MNGLKEEILQQLLRLLDTFSEFLNKVQSDEKMTKHLLVLGFLMLGEFELYKENELLKLFLVVVETFEADIAKFVINFIALE